MYTTSRYQRLTSTRRIGRRIGQTLALLGGLLAAQLPASSAQAQSLSDKRVLVFSRTKGYRHQSIPTGQRTLMELGKQNGFAVDTTEDAGKFTEANLKRYSAVVFLSTTGDVLDDAQQINFERYIQAGGGYVGIHAATDTEYDWPWYNKLAGAQFASHPGNPNVQEGETYAVNKNHASMMGFPDRWKVKDEFYDFKNVNKDINVLVKIDEKSYKDGKMGDNHPMAWYHNFSGGKAFYTNFGHQNETFADPVFLKHLLGGLQSVMAPQLDYAKARSQTAPEENRFEREVLVSSLDEPTELVVLPGGKILFGERKGMLKMYNPATKKTKVVARMPVYTKFEYGLMGVNADPNYAANKRLFLYYSPDAALFGADTAQHLSQFTYDDVRDTLVMNTEKVLLRVPVKRTGCCHTGGSIAWDRTGNLYLSTGDDTNPFNSDGFSPSDNREDRQGWDALSTSSNTNDLRGKILRIKPDGNGGYTIPEGNLFGMGTAKARPEIYVMGNRNPYRIAVDQRTGFLYWGEVGPDAGEDKAKRGPRGHDEMNQARKAGFFGWPMFVGDNKAYEVFDFKDNKSMGMAYDAAKPINNSPHNTGLNELPPAQKAFIYYPYADSPEFGAIVGKGGRNAMGGPVYYYDDYAADSKVKFPRAYDGKFFAYDWMRDWINPVTMTPEGDFVKMERFAPSMKFSHVIDMQFAQDGSLYTLEYGQNWFAANDDARLSRITYNPGNRRPVAVVAANKMVGAAPLAVTFSTKGTMDYDGDALTYAWDFGKGLARSTQPNPTVTFSKPGIYTPTLTVTDAAGNKTTQTITLKVGNDMPKVDLALKGNKTFFFPKQPIAYQAVVADKEDGTLAKGINPEDVTMTINYIEGFDKTLLAQGHQANLGFSAGKRLIELSDCKSCHAIDKKSIGPAYIDIAKKYRSATRVRALAQKIISGGGGEWGEQAMSAHPQLKVEEAEDMVRYIQSLADTKVAEKHPLQGNYMTQDHTKDGSYILTATYTDRGNGQIGPLTQVKSVALRSPKFKAVNFDEKKDISTVKMPTGNEVAIATKNGSYLAYNDIDLTGISGLSASVTARAERSAGGKVEVRADSPTGPLLGDADVAVGTSGPVSIPFKKPTSGMHKLYLVFVNPESANKSLMSVDDLTVQQSGM
ncbi:ThuA domain-containing protein [uncultured Fibrella sp.]|uniref:ThuA domain-containing protein n=1 Tax=uncultured Fibrella sp. TaxID=1284596 RepID=UPI0035CA8934